MDPKEIQKKFEEFKAASIAAKAGLPAQPAEPEPVAGLPTQPAEPEPVGAAGPCIQRCFKDLIANLKFDFIGQGDSVKDLVEVIANSPECEVKVG